ncbi:MAG TPA: hypothetical protein V6C72_07525 [Chroococcales cyanobacterium]
MAPRHGSDASASGGGSQSNQPTLTNLMDEVMFERMKSVPNMPARPEDPHYVGQTYWDTMNGVLDLNSGKFDKGENYINTAIKDLGKEDTLIKGSQADGNTAAKDIIDGKTDDAETALTKTIKDLKGNYYNTEARNDYQDALKELKSDDPDAKWKALQSISKAEEALQDRQTRVENASQGLTDGLKDFNSGNFDKGMYEFGSAMMDLQRHHGQCPPEGPPHQPYPPEGPPYGPPYGPPQWPPYGGGWHHGRYHGPIMYPMDAAQTGSDQSPVPGQGTPAIEYTMAYPQGSSPSGAPNTESINQYQGYPGTLYMGDTQSLYTQQV